MMEGINNTLFAWFHKSKLIGKIGLNDNSGKSELKSALEGDECSRFKATINLSKRVWANSPALGVYPDMSLLAELEDTGEFYPKYRDHSTHAFKVYLLGLYIYEKNDSIRGSFEHNDINDDKFLQTWAAASLWHDIGYLFESEKTSQRGEAEEKIIAFINAQYMYPLSCIPGFTLSKDEEEYFIDENGIHRPKFATLEDIENATDCFEHLRNIGMVSGLTNDAETNAIQVLYSYIKGNVTGDNIPKHADHGIVSAVLLLQTWIKYRELLHKLDKCIISSLGVNNHDLLTKTRGEIDDYEPIIIEAARAIAIHNIYKRNFENKHIVALRSKKVYIKQFDISFEKSPFAYLLKVTDALQEWDRVYFGHSKRIEATTPAKDMNIYVRRNYIDIWFRSDDITFRNLEYKDSKYSKLINDLSDCSNVKKVLFPIKSSQIPPEDHSNQIVNICFGNLQKEMMEAMRDNFKCSDSDIGIILYNRDRSDFSFVRSDGTVADIENEAMLQNAKTAFKKSLSAVFTDENEHQIGLALISTNVGALGFIVLKDMPQGNLPYSRNTITKLNEYGAIIGDLYLKGIQRLVQREVDKGVPFNFNALREINKYVPFGHDNRCISVFLDIRQLTSLFVINREDNGHNTLELLHQFSNEVWKISNNHYGIISCHFGGGMLISFPSVDSEERNRSCFRAICTMFQIRKAFKKVVESFAKRINDNSICEKVKIGMGASSGKLFFSAFGYGTSLFYTGVEADIAFAKKLEYLSGRGSPLRTISEETTYNNDEHDYYGEILVSPTVRVHCERLCAQLEKPHGIDFQPPASETGRNLTYPYEINGHSSFYIVEGIDNKQCPVPEDERCLLCPNKNSKFGGQQ